MEGVFTFTTKGWLVPPRVENVATRNLMSRHSRNFCQLAILKVALMLNDNILF